MKKLLLYAFFLILFIPAMQVCLAQVVNPTPKTYYVDSSMTNNNGNGLSWATAKKDIQAAINLASSIDQVWVKAGTYYPTDIPTGLTADSPNTAVSNRDKTLLLRDGLKLYGGFVGTETSISQRIPGANNTIIDGDIGTPGDSTDNCYHLMVYLGSYSTVGVTIDGFTIRNGNAGTYGSTVPVYDAATFTVGTNTYSIDRVFGGGIYLQQGLNNVINNVVFEKNYAKNRGFGLFTDGGFGLYCSYTVTNCYFVNNYGIESSYGSWATNYGNNFGYNLVFYNNHILNYGFGDGVAVFLFEGISKFANCSFVSNSSISGAVIDLANGAQCYFSNSLFYNNTQSVIYNPTNPNAPDFFNSNVSGSFGKFTNCSMSSQDSFYSSANYAMALGSTGNIFNQNPAFADINSLQGSDGKYFTSDDGLALPINSPCKNAGNNDSVPPSLTKDITGANRILDTIVDMGAYEIDAAPACNTVAPATTNQTFCSGDSATVASLSATGTNIKWYATATGGSALSSSTVLTDGTKYYASQTVGSCESMLRSADSVTLNPVPTVVPTSDITVCNASKVSAIDFTSTLTSSTILFSWTNDNTSIGLAATGNGNIASFTAVNNGILPITANIVVTPTIANSALSCAGIKDTFTITINPTPKIVPLDNQTVCSGSSTNEVTFSDSVTGTIFNWTNNNPSIGLAANGSGNIPSFLPINNSTSTVSSTILVSDSTLAGCKGTDTSFTIMVGGLSVAPDSINNTEPIVCASNAFATLSVSGGDLGAGAEWKWYADSIGSTSIGTGSILSNIPITKNTMFYVRAEGPCNITAAASTMVKLANLVSLVQQHWGDVLIFDNSSNNFVAWQWYKNNQPVAGAVFQYYSELGGLNGSYYAVATDKKGNQEITCPLQVAAGSFTGTNIQISPNPSQKGIPFTITSSFSSTQLAGSILSISDLYGNRISQITQVSAVNTMRAPNTSGIYIVTLMLSNGYKYSANLLVN